MSGEKDLPKTDDAIKNEAIKDAADIKKAGSPDAAYQKFRDEINNMETAGFTGAQRLSYQKQLTSALKGDVDRVIVGYLNSAESANLKDKSGYVNHDLVYRTVGQQSRYGTDADAALPNLVIDNFSRIASQNMDMDENKYLTTEDIKKTTSQFEDRTNKETSVKSIQDAKVAENLIGPDMDRFFENLDYANGWSKKVDNVAYKGDIDRFLKENANAKPSEQKALEAVKYIQQHWDDDIGHQLRGWDEGAHRYRDSISKDSIAQASGYLDAQDFRTKTFNADGSKKDVNADRDLVVSAERPYDYGTHKTTYQVNKENELISYTFTVGDKSIDYVVDKSGTIRDRKTQEIAGYNGNLAPDGTFTYNKTQNDASTVQTDTPKPADTKPAVAPTEVNYNTGDTNRVLKLDPTTKKLLEFTEAPSKDPTATKTYKVGEDGIAINAANPDDKKKVTYNAEKNELSVDDKKQELKQEPQKEAPQVVTFKTADTIRTVTIDPQTKAITQFTEATTKEPGNVRTYKPDGTGDFINVENANDKHKVAYDADKKELTIDGTKQTETTESEQPKKASAPMTIKYDGNIERTVEIKDGKLSAYTQIENGKTSKYTVNPESGIVTDVTDPNKPQVQTWRAGLSRNGDFVSTKSGQLVTEKALSLEKPATEEKSTKTGFFENATQHTQQGYWQVAEKMIQNGDDKLKVSPTENTILMRALQRMHKKHPKENLGGYKFVKNQNDMKELEDEINAYSNGKPAFKTAAPELIKKLSTMAQSSQPSG